MKKLLILILICVGVLVLLTPIGKFKGEAFENIMYRKNLVTGIITADNGDKSYAVEIGESGKSIKKIFTLSPDPDLAVGDKARVLLRGGNKEDMILLAPTKPAIIITRYHAFCRHYSKPPLWDDYLGIYDLDGTLIKEIAIDYGFGTYQDIAMDAQGNIYDCMGGDKIRKYDKDLNLILTQDVEVGYYWIQTINMGSDGYLYTLTMDDNWMRLERRKTSDLTVVANCILDSYYDGLAIDSNGNFFTVCNYGADTDYVCKIRFSDGVIVAKKYLEDIEHNAAGIGIMGNNVYFASGGIVKIDGVRADGIYIDTDLSGSFHALVWGTSAENYRLATVSGNAIVVTGWTAQPDNKSMIRKYNSNRNIVWTIITSGGGGNPYGIGAYNFAN